MTFLLELGLNGVIDCHTHTGLDGYNFVQGRYPSSQKVSELVAKMDSTGVEGAITFPFPSTDYWNVDTLVRENRLSPSGKQDFPYQLENKNLFIDSKDHKHRLYPFACINPKYEVRKQVDYLESCFSRGEIAGLKLHTLATQSSAADLISSPLADFALVHNLPILIHSGLDAVSHPANVIKLSEHYRERLRLCVAHVACFDQKSLNEITRHDNVFVDTCPFIHLLEKAKRGSKYLAKNEIVEPGNPVGTILRFYATLSDKLIWGTDEPYTSVIKPDRNTIVEGSYAGEVGLLVGLAGKNITAFENITNRNTQRFLFG